MALFKKKQNSDPPPAAEDNIVRHPSSEPMALKSQSASTASVTAMSAGRRELRASGIRSMGMWVSLLKFAQ